MNNAIKCINRDIIYENLTLHGLTLETSTVGSKLMEMEKDPIKDNINTYVNFKTPLLQDILDLVKKWSKI